MHFRFFMKKCITFLRKKGIFWRIFHSIQFFLELQALVAELIDFFLNYQCLSMLPYLRFII